MCFQLWDETKLGLPSGDVVGLPGPHLHFYQEEGRCVHTHTHTHTHTEWERIPVGCEMWDCFPSERPDFGDAIIMRRGASVEHVVSLTHIMYTHTHTAVFVYALTFRRIKTHSYLIIQGGKCVIAYRETCRQHKYMGWSLKLISLLFSPSLLLAVPSDPQDLSRPV